MAEIKFNVNALTMRHESLFSYMSVSGHSHMISFVHFEYGIPHAQ